MNSLKTVSRKSNISCQGVKRLVIEFGVTTLHIVKMNFKNFRMRPCSHGTGSVWSPYQFEKSQDEHDS